MSVLSRPALLRIDGLGELKSSIEFDRILLFDG
jgi:hypothetical protein